MVIRLGPHRFDDLFYDVEGDVLYMHKGRPVAAAETLVSPEGHAIRLNESREIIGITVIGAKWLAEHDGRITVTVSESTHAPERLETSAKDLAPALAA